MRGGTAFGGATTGGAVNGTGRSCVYQAPVAFAVIATGNALNACRSEVVWLAQMLADIGIASPPWGAVPSSQQS